MVEVLWGLKENKEEFKLSHFSEKLLLDWKYSLVIRYKREKDNKYYVAWTLSFIFEKNKIIIMQLQWSKDKRIWFRVNSSFSNVNFYLKVLEESFSKKWFFIEVEKFPNWIEDKSISSRADYNYDLLRKWINVLNNKYFKK
jgi:hypothetical protein